MNLTSRRQISIVVVLLLVSFLLGTLVGSSLLPRTPTPNSSSSTVSTSSITQGRMLVILDTGQDCSFCSTVVGDDIANGTTVLNLWWLADTVSMFGTVGYWFPGNGTIGSYNLTSTYLYRLDPTMSGVFVRFDSGSEMLVILRAGAAYNLGGGPCTSLESYNCYLQGAYVDLRQIVSEGTYDAFGQVTPSSSFPAFPNCALDTGAVPPPAAQCQGSRSP